MIFELDGVKLYKSKAGYVYVYDSINQCYIKRSRVVIENSIGRKMTDREHAHHINGIKDDDRIENLELLTDIEHAKEHFSRKRPNRQKYEVYNSFPLEVIKDKIITLMPDYRTYIGRSCKECNELFWTRKQGKSLYCSQTCVMNILWRNPNFKGKGYRKVKEIA